MEKIDKSVIISLELIRDECDKRKCCEDCPYSCTYNVNKQISYACVLKDTPDRWQLETMEGFNDGR